MHNPGAAPPEDSWQTGEPQPRSPVSTLPYHPERIGRYRIEKVLGEGGFGRVYLAHDDQLHRRVAIKVPRPDRLSRPEDAEAYLAEARVVASLDHPNIVPVFDVGSTEDGLCYVVSKFIEGCDLAHKIRATRFSFQESADLVATVAEALHYAHRKKLVHRDIKPANLLIDTDGKPFVADFGLALQEQDFGKGAGFLGTPSYMSPEQARGEGHRVDGRSDIFSLGVIFYELLTGCRPFGSESMMELLEQITKVEARPPRQVDDTIPKELERICLKTLSKRASERYTTARDLAEDLRHFLSQVREQENVVVQASVPAPVAVTPTPLATPTPSLPVTPSLDQPPIKIVPKGLRSFDAHDADFFLELLPGPRDRDGLPDSLRFWKMRIEETDPDNTFSMGLIYGPSGCGKSSLVKAGLLPRLSASVLPIYIEATGQDTEVRLLKGLRKHYPDLPPQLGLSDSLTALRRGRFLPPGKKVLLVLDQFEQWLHARKEEENTELVQALRQCDGKHLQCLVLVRDDFWLAVSRFLRDLEVDLVPGRNIALVDLFDLDHAKKVLAAFGRAYDKLPEKAIETSKEQNEFLIQAVSALTQEGKVICVRLALFAEMMKCKPWTKATFKKVGGAEGVGVTFLEETFSFPAANPKHRLHQKAVRRVLKALLPKSGTDIKGHMRSYHALLTASGLSDRPKDFDDLIRSLDSDIRLITPTDPEGKDPGESAGVRPGVSGEKYFQLTHDYLVPSLRDWLTRKQKETQRGRAELLLADRADMWNARPETRQLPSLPQWLQIRCLTAQQTWTPQQKKMMRKAGRYHAVRGFVVAAIAILLGLVGWEGYGQFEGRQLRDRVLEANTTDVPAIVKDMAPYRRWVNPLLREAYAQAGRDNDLRKQLHASLGLMPVDPGQVEFLLGQLREAEAREITVIREALLTHQSEISERLWRILEDQEADMDHRLRVACALARYTPDDLRWDKVSGDVAARLVNQNALVLGKWAEALQPVGRCLLTPLASFLEDEKRSGAERRVSANLYKTFAEGQRDAFAGLEKALEETKDVKRQANVGTALLVMGRGEKVWPLLKHPLDPTLRSFLIDRLAPGGVDPKAIVTRFDQEQDVSIKRALLLSLGEFNLDRLPLVERQHLLPRLAAIYQEDPDPGLHSAAEWLLRQWQADAILKKIDNKLALEKDAGARGWYVNRQGQTMMLVPHSGRTFAIASREVTAAQFLLFRRDHEVDKNVAPTGTCPVNSVDWYNAAAYCNWLSMQEGLPKEEWCYEPNDNGAYGPGMKMTANWWQRTGYRLPTEAEWEDACRAGVRTGFSFGELEDLLGKYAWYAGNSSTESHPGGMLRPNDLGLFDMHGNAWEWCQDSYKEIVTGETKELENSEDKEDRLRVTSEASRVLRGGSFFSQSKSLRCRYRLRGAPSLQDNTVSFRPARTVRSLNPDADVSKPQPLERGLLQVAKELVKELRGRGYANVGVLKFQISKDGKIVSDNVGTLNLYLARRLEVALVLAQRDHPLGIIDNASAVAERTRGANHLSRAGRAKLFTANYPLAWGDKEVMGDAFVTGVAKVSTDLKTLQIGLLLFDNKTDKLEPVLKDFTVVNLPEHLVELGESFSTRGLFDKDTVTTADEKREKTMRVAARVKDQKQRHPAEDPQAPVQLEIRYKGKPVALEVRGGQAFVRAPKEEEEVELVLKRDGTRERYGVVLKVNGDNTIEKQRLPDGNCRPWILEPDAGPLSIKGYQINNRERQMFRVASLGEARELEMRYGADVGMITITVFREQKGKPKPPDPSEEAREAAAVAKGTLQTKPEEGEPAKPDSFGALKARLLSDANRGVITEGEVRPGELRQVKFTADPLAVMTLTVNYYQPKK